MSPRFYLGFLSECQYTFSKKGNFARNLSLSRVIELGIQAVSCISRFNCSFIESYLTLKTFGIINSSHFEIIIIRDSANVHLPADLTTELNAAPRAIEEVNVIVSGAAQSLASNEAFALQHTKQK